jgi:catechol 2,3-dioxygenase-like lactoylglutathione lyase family enzyme
MILGLNHVALSVPDMHRAVEFYCGQLGFTQVGTMSWAVNSRTSGTVTEITRVPGTSADAVHLRGPGFLLELFHFQAGDPMPRPQDPQRPVVDHGYTHICLAVKDLDGEYRRLREAGMEFHSEPKVVAPGVRCVYGRDPFGNVIELEETRGRVITNQSSLEFLGERMFTLGFGGVLLALFAAVFLWQTPWIWGNPVTAAETVPDLRWVVGGLLLAVFPLVMWRRCVRQLKRLQVERGDIYGLARE